MKKWGDFIRLVKYLFLLLLVSLVSGYTIYYGNYDDSLLKEYIDVPVVAVSSDLNTGIAGQARISLIQGQGKVVFDERTSLSYDSISSVLSAVEFAENYAEQRHSYFISYDLLSDKVSGKSSSSAIALGIIALLENKSVDNIAITGEVDSQGNLKQTGSLLLKIMAAGSHGIEKMYIAENQSQIYYYDNYGSNFIGKRIDLKRYAKETYNMSLVEISNLRQVD